MSDKKGWSIRSRQQELLKRATENFVIDPPFPRNLMFELSNACNHACIFCANSKMKRRKRRASKDLFQNIVQQAYALGSREIGLYTTGEPFVHTDLEEFVAYCKQLGFEYTYISTNGALASKDRFKALLDAGIDSIKFSINAGNRETYTVVHGHDDWENVIENLRFVSDYRKKIGRDVKLGVSYVVIAQNQSEIETAKQLLEPLVDDLYFALCDSQQGYMPENQKSVMIDESWSTIKAPCIMLFSRAHVTAEGYLNLCCIDYENYLAVADLTKVTLADAWVSDKFKEMRQRHLDNQLKGTLCYNCITGKNEAIEPITPEIASLLDFRQSESENLEKQRSRLKVLTPP